MENRGNNKVVVLTPKSLPVICISAEALATIVETIGSLKAETGGVLGRKEDSPLITHYHFDEGSKNSAATYSPDCNTLNSLFKHDWNPKGIRLNGFIHSHPGWMSRLSHGDEIYAERILKAIEAEWLWLPIINTVPDTGEFKLTPWVVYPAKQGVQVVRAKIKVVAESVAAKAGKVYTLLSEFRDQILDEIIIPGSAIVSAVVDERRVQATTSAVEPYINNSDGIQAVPHEVRIIHQHPVPNLSKDISLSQTFDRVKEAYDLDIMVSSRIICVGAGGAASWIEELTRTGIGQFILIDPDVVTATNLATQATYRHDIGRLKVDCIAERIHDINPAAKVITVAKHLDALSDEEMAYLAADAIDGRYPRQTVICGLTDNFYAQARVNRLALNFGLPSLCAQVYREGRGAEITFTYPGITPACHRCILSSRYKYFLEQGHNNPVTSHGTPIFATTRLNAIKGFILLAILHHGTTHPRWGSMLSRIGNRNLIQIRLDPDFTETMGIPVFDRVFEKADKTRLLYDETIWLPQEQECPETGYAVCCPDCGGTGNLLNAIGTFEDTRIIRSCSPQIKIASPASCTSYFTQLLIATHESMEKKENETVYQRK